MYGEGMAQAGNAAKEVVGGFRLREGLEPAPKRMGQIEEQVTIGQQAAEGLHSAIGRLEVAIAAVLRCEPTSETGKGEPIGTVGLAECLRVQNRLVAAATERINSMIDRCEL